ncbi:MAG: NAD-dependent epimerase/dehydratase family protein [Solirubrobacterales bacterium]|nr:NAD-dependent epimerase/dehydratase family protein [Solirubrobacterales bacterium]
MILLTGASGFVGGHIAERLVAEGQRVRCLVRTSSETGRLESLAADGDGPGVELVLGDLNDAGSLARALDGVDAVVHSAALVTDWATVEEIRAANVEGTRALVTAAVRARVRRFVQISTTDVYGYPGGRLVSEEYVPSGFANWYSQTKREAEAVLLDATDGTPTELVILRPATIYGPRAPDIVGEIAKGLRQRYLPLIGGGNVNAGLIYVENLADAVLAAMSDPRAAGQAFNVVDGLDVTWRQFIFDLARGVGAPPPLLRLRYRVAWKLGVGFEEGYRAVRKRTGLSAPPLLSRAAVQVMGRPQDFSNQKLRSTLGWEPRVGYADGLAATLAWLSEDYFG